MDITLTTAPKSDQQNFDDYVGGPKTVTVSGVRAGSDEQPVDVELVEFPGRPYKPSKSMRRVLVAAWGPESTPWAGRRMTLVGDPTVKFGGQTVGGIKISHLSHITKPLNLSLTVTKGKRAAHTVQPLPDVAPEPAVDPNAITPDQLKALGAAMKAHGITDRDAAREYIGGTVNREVESSKSLTQAEAASLLNRLKAEAAIGAEPPLVGWES